MKKIYNYKQFLLERNLIKDFTKGILSKVFNFFLKIFGKDAWLYKLKYMEKNNKLPKGIELLNFDDVSIPEIPDENIDKEYTDEIDEETIRSQEGTYERLINKLNEEVVPLAHPHPDIINLYPQELKDTLVKRYKAYIKRPDKMRSTFIWGAPGIGKTEIVKQMAKELDLYLIVWHLASIEPTDFIGVPYISDKDGTKRTKSALPDIFPTSDGNKKGGILFFDELNRANKMVLSAALPLVLDGEVGMYKLPNNWWIVAAGNRKEDVGSIAQDLEKALGNRFKHVNLVTSVEEWEDWAIENGVHYEVIGFLNFNKSYFHKLDPDDESPAWASPRAWVDAAIEYEEALEDSSRLSDREIKNIFSQSVGLEAATQFVEYLKMKKSFDEEEIKKVYEEPSKAKEMPERIDLARAAAIGIAMYKKDEKLTEKDLENVFEYVLGIDKFEVSNLILSYLKKTHSKQHPDYRGKDKDEKIADLWHEKRLEWYNKFRKAIEVREEGIDV
jgi:hypothetical protein